MCDNFRPAHFKRQNNLLESRSTVVIGALCEKKSTHTEFTTGVHKKVRKWFRNRLYINTQGHAESLRHTGGGNSTFNCLYSSSSTLYCIHLSVHLSIHPSIHLSIQPPIHLSPPFGQTARHTAAWLKHAAEHHFRFYDTERERKGRRWRRNKAKINQRELSEFGSLNLKFFGFMIQIRCQCFRRRLTLTNSSDVHEKAVNQTCTRLGGLLSNQK